MRSGNDCQNISIQYSWTQKKEQLMNHTSLFLNCHKDT